MSALTATVGYPPHRVVSFRCWTNPYGVRFTDWEAACGASGSAAGYVPFSQAGQARRAELCSSCFPGKRHGGYFPGPVDASSAG